MTALTEPIRHQLTLVAPSTRDVALDAFKLFAFVLMCFDHLAYFAAWDELTRLPGRAVLPMFAVMLAYKSAHHSRGGVVARLLTWGAIAQLAVVPLGWLSINVLVTLGVGVWIAQQQQHRQVMAMLGLMCLATFEAAASVQVVQFGAFGIFLVTASVWAQVNREWWLAVAAAALFINQGTLLEALVSVLGVLVSLAVIHRNQVFSWVQRVPTTVWYALYPAHLVTLWVASHFFP